MPRTTMGIYSVSTDHSNCIHDDRNDDDREQMLTISSEELVLKCKTYNCLRSRPRDRDVVSQSVSLL